MVGITYLPFVFDPSENPADAAAAITVHGCDKIRSKGNQIMENWYSVSLGDGITASSPAAEIEERFQAVFLAAGKPPEMAVFTRSKSEGRLHCEVIAYFSPAAADVAKAFDAQPCTKPDREGLSLLMGSEHAWSAHFHNSGS